MRRSLVIFAGTAMIAASLALGFLLFPLEPTLVTHAQTPITAPGALPATGAGGAIGGGFGLAVWIGLMLAGAATLAVAMFLVARRPKVRS